jgi:hypothetical protein
MSVIEEYYYTYQGSTGRGAGYDMSDYSLADACAVAQRLMESGKLHQPRQFGAHARRLPYHWLETVLANEDLEKSPAISSLRTNGCEQEPSPLVNY